MNEKINPKEALKRLEKHLEKVEDLLKKNYKEGGEEKSALIISIQGFVRAVFKDDDKKLEDFKKARPFRIYVGGTPIDENEEQGYYLEHLKKIKNHLLTFKEELEIIIDSSKSLNKEGVPKKKEEMKIDNKTKEGYIVAGGFVFIGFIFVYSGGLNFSLASDIGYWFIGLGVAAFKWSSIAEVLLHWAKNQEKSSINYSKQIQKNTKGSNQIGSIHGDVHIHQKS